jgi:MFS superfamily sulfate permease-like transporter
VLYRWDAPLFFANASVFQEQVLRAVDHAPTPTRWIVVAAEPLTDIDVTSAEMLEELEGQLQKRKVDLRFAEMKDPVKDMLKRYGLFDFFGADGFYPTVGEAVDGYLAAHSVEWVDWEEREEKQGEGKP